MRARAIRPTPIGHGWAIEPIAEKGKVASPLLGGGTGFCEA